MIAYNKQKTPLGQVKFILLEQRYYSEEQIREALKKIPLKEVKKRL